MGRTRVAEFRPPSEDGFADIVRELKLDQKQQAMLQATLDEVAANCKGAGAGPPDKQIKTALKSLERALDRLQLQLKRQDVIDALGAIETYGALGHLFSATAAIELANGADPEVALADIERLVAHKRFVGEPLRQSDLDALCLVDRQRRLNHQTADAMQLAVAKMREPISIWLNLASQDKGGNRPKSDREWLILLLARDAPKIIGRTPSSTPSSPFFKLCAAALDACHFDGRGYEEAVERCLKGYGEWLDWHQRGEPGTSSGN